MTKRDGESYSKVQRASAPRERVYDALTTLNGLGGWWTPIVSGSGEAGGQLRFGFEGLDENIVMKVEEAKRPSLVRWHCVRHTALPDWAGTTLVFEIVERSPTTSEIRFQHIGLTPMLDCFDDCAVGWDHFLGSIAGFVATGHGSPYSAE